MNWMKVWRAVASGCAAAAVTGASAVGVAAGPDDASEVVRPHPVVRQDTGSWSDLLFCGQTPLAEMLSSPARPPGDPRPPASVILATGRLTRVIEGYPGYQKMILNDVRTLRGPRVADGSAGWIEIRHVWYGSAPFEDQPRFDGDLGSLWGLDGRMFAFYEPGESSVGAVLVTAPVVGDQVIFSQAGCWNVDGLSSRAYTGPVAQLPGSRTYDLVATSLKGFRAVPLAVVVGLIPG
jgi:hypothetical protein